ncbi:MAG: hypothetical protein WB421_10800 [Terriglobales bacterium]
MVKKQWVVALVLFLLIPAVWMLGGMLFNQIHPEVAAGHPNYVQNYHRLSLLKHLSLWGSEAGVVVLWVLVCLLVIRSKKRSYVWLFLAALGPLGFAVLAMLNDRAPGETDRYARFVRSLKVFVRVGYELCTFVIIWVLAYQGMVLKRTLMIRHEAAITGMSTAQIMDLQNASSGMWAFAEGNEVMYLVVLLYLLWPIVFSLAGRAASPKAR